MSQLDVVDPVSIAAFAKRWLDSNRPLHILVNNAAALPSKTVERDARGHEVQFSAGARVVNVSSSAHRFGQIGWDDPRFATGYDSRAA